MFKPINNCVVLKRSKTEAVSASGIITDTNAKTLYTVVATNSHTEKLQDKVVYTKEPPTNLDGDYYAIDYKDILAYAS